MSREEWQPWRPASYREGLNFTKSFCDRCRRDPRNSGKRDPEAGNSDLCNILLRTALHELGDPAYPKEWVSGGTSASATCTAFDPVDGGLQ